MNILWATQAGSYLTTLISHLHFQQELSLVASFYYGIQSTSGQKAAKQATCMAW
jgi:hypothetical protein